jgi:hypothetical protein
VSSLTSIVDFILEERQGHTGQGLSSVNKEEGAVAWFQATGTPMKSLIVSDLDIQALVDDELDDVERSRVLSALRQNLLLKTRYEQLLAQKRQVAMSWADEQSSVH